MLPSGIIADLVTKPLVWSSTLQYTHAPCSLCAKAGQGSDWPGLMDKGKYLQRSGNEGAAKGICHPEAAVSFPKLPLWVKLRAVSRHVAKHDHAG